MLLHGVWRVKRFAANFVERVSVTVLPVASAARHVLFWQRVCVCINFRDLLARRHPQGCLVDSRHSEGSCDSMLL